MGKTKILFVDDEKNVLRSLQRLFLDDDYTILTALTGEEGLVLLDENPDVLLVVSDYRMPGMDGIEFLTQVCEKFPDTIRIVLSGYADTASVVSAINEGQIYKFIPKPWCDEELEITLSKAIEVYFLQKKNRQLAEKLLYANEELELLVAGLESQVEERTASLMFQNEALVFSQNILHVLPIAVIGLDLQGLVVQSNQMADEILSVNNTSITGMDIRNVLPEALVELALKAQTNSPQHELVTMDGTQYWLRSVVMNSGDGQYGTIVTFVSVA